MLNYQSHLRIMGRQKFSRALKRSICIEYMQSGKSRKEIAMKYNLPNVGTLSGWINSCLSPLEIHEKCASLQPVTVQMDIDMAKEREEKPMDVAAMSALIEAQRKQIGQLEKQLKYSRDKVLALNTLIDVIEEQGIKVRKKAGVRQ
jgi:transposase-like protein